MYIYGNNVNIYVYIIYIYIYISQKSESERCKEPKGLIPIQTRNFILS